MIRGWRLHLRTTTTLTDLARTINAVTRGWINYYWRYYRSELCPVLACINDYLVRWAMRKYKRRRGQRVRTIIWLRAVARREPNLFVHWPRGVRP